MDYDIEETADELLLSTNELKEILDVYFEENTHLQTECYTLITNQQTVAFQKMMHSLKGASKNLRLNTIAAMAEEMEGKATMASKEDLLASLTKIQQEITVAKQYIDSFYNQILK